MALSLILSARMHGLSPLPENIVLLLQSMESYSKTPQLIAQDQKYAFSFLDTEKIGFFRPYFLSRAGTHLGFGYLLRNHCQTVDEVFSILESSKKLDAKGFDLIKLSLVREVGKAVMKDDGVGRTLRQRKETALAMMLNMVTKIGDAQLGDLSKQVISEVLAMEGDEKK